MSSNAASVPVSTAGSDLLGAAGLVLSVVAWTHAFLILVPPHFGTAPWEFAAATQTIDVFPLGVTGMALLAYASSVGEWRKRAVVLIVACVLSVLLLTAMAGLILLDLMVAWKSVTAFMRENLLRTAGKSLFFAILFNVFFVWVALRLYRARRRKATLRR